MNYYENIMHFCDFYLFSLLVFYISFLQQQFQYTATGFTLRFLNIMTKMKKKTTLIFYFIVEKILHIKQKKKHFNKFSLGKEQILFIFLILFYNTLKNLTRQAK